MNPQTKAWLIIICTVLGTGGTAYATASSGGCKTSMAIVTALVAASGAVLHLLMQTPDKPQQPASTEAVKNETKP